jgi:GNAT superfamily N-acetyltransferase
MSASSTVRIAKPDDYQEVWRLLLTVHRENGIFSLSPNKVDWLIKRILNPDQIPLGDTGVRGAIGVIGSVGSLEGLVLVTLGTYWYSEDLHLEEFTVTVDPEHRKTGHAQALIQWMKDQVEVTKLPLITGIISNIRTEAKCRLYRRMLPKIGEFFYLGPKGSTLTPGLVAISS